MFQPAHSAVADSGFPAGTMFLTETIIPPAAPSLQVRGGAADCPGSDRYFSPAAGTQIRVGIQRNRFFTPAAGLCGNRKEKRPVGRICRERSRRVQSPVRTYFAAETAARAFVREERHVETPRALGTGRAQDCSGGAHAGADAAGCAGIRKLREHPAETFGKLFHFIQQKLPPERSVGHGIPGNRKQGGSGLPGALHHERKRLSACDAARGYRRGIPRQNNSVGVFFFSQKYFGLRQIFFEGAAAGFFVTLRAVICDQYDSPVQREKTPEFPAERTGIFYGKVGCITAFAGNSGIMLYMRSI